MIWKPEKSPGPSLTWPGSNRAMLIGVDFDNTIVCYDEVFYQAAVKQGLVPKETPVVKDAVRDYLRRCGQEDLWTELQGHVYGACMADAAPFPGVLDFFARCRERSISAYIISHKTRHPFRGQQYDLHQSARGWLKSKGLDGDHVFLELTKEAKLKRIAEVGCTHFIDDLPEFLGEPAFPRDVERILFDPNNHHPEARQFHRFASWPEIGDRLLPS